MSFPGKSDIFGDDGKIKSELLPAGGSLTLGETDTTAHRGDHGKAAYDFSQAAFSGLAKITVGPSAPVAPGTGDLWIDTTL